MTSFDAERARQAASSLLKQSVTAAMPVRQGGNNRLFRITAASNVTYALKTYPAQAEDPRDRLSQEWEALSLLTQDSGLPLPLPLARDASIQTALYTWIDGASPGPARPEDMDALAEFLIRIQALAPLAQHIRPASAACFSAQGAVTQFSERRAALDQVSLSDLKTFLNRELDHFFKRAVKRLSESSLDLAKELAQDKRILSPSDFGMHNAIRRQSGSLAFVDFEYFGWDDPVKAVSDVLLHPGHDLTEELRKRFKDKISPFLAERDSGYLARFDLLFPLFGAIWCLILLNEFRPDRWARRVQAGQNSDQSLVQARQLGRARHLCAWLEDWIDAA